MVEQRLVGYPMSDLTQRVEATERALEHLENRIDVVEGKLETLNDLTRQLARLRAEVEEYQQP